MRGRKRFRVNGKVELEHVLIAEKALGKRLPPKAVVHHIDGDGFNNAPSNLLICQDRAYHNLLHRRLNAYRATGNPNARLCPYCEKWETDLSTGVTGKGFRHTVCHTEYERRRRARKS